MKRIASQEYVTEAAELGATIRHHNRRLTEAARVDRGLRHRSARQRRVSQT